MTSTVEFKSEHALRLLEELERLGGNVRSARNAISTSGAVDDVSLVVESRFGKRSGIATCNEFDDATLRRCVQRAEEIARLAPVD